MIPHSITDAGLVFIARGRPYQITKDHPRFENIKGMISDPDQMADDVADALDWITTLDRITGGRVNTVGGILRIDDTPLSQEWAMRLASDPGSSRILLILVGDVIQVEGDEDCPDGPHMVSGIDLTDVENTLYVECAEAGFYGYPRNTCVKDWIPNSLGHAVENAA